MGKLDHYIEKLKQPIVEWESEDDDWDETYEQGQKNNDWAEPNDSPIKQSTMKPEAWKNFLYNATYDKLNDILEELFDEAMRDRVSLKMGEKREAAKKVIKKAFNELIRDL
jgi:hypothetical protein